MEMLVLRMQFRRLFRCEPSFHRVGADGRRQRVPLGKARFIDSTLQRKPVLVLLTAPHGCFLDAKSAKKYRQNPAQTVQQERFPHPRAALGTDPVAVIAGGTARHPPVAGAVQQGREQIDTGPSRRDSGIPAEQFAHPGEEGRGDQRRVGLLGAAPQLGRKAQPAAHFVIGGLLPALGQDPGVSLLVQDASEETSGPERGAERRYPSGGP